MRIVHSSKSIARTPLANDNEKQSLAIKLHDDRPLHLIVHDIQTNLRNIYNSFLNSLNGLDAIENFSVNDITPTSYPSLHFEFIINADPNSILKIEIDPDTISIYDHRKCYIEEFEGEKFISRPKTMYQTMASAFNHIAEYIDQYDTNLTDNIADDVVNLGCKIDNMFPHL